MANLELSKHGGAHTTHGGDAEKKTEVSFVRLDYATEDKDIIKPTKNMVIMPMMYI